MNQRTPADPRELMKDHGAVVVDCRFSLADEAEGERLYQEGHVPGAYYLHLERDMSGPVMAHGGRHPLPDPGRFAATLATCGIEPDTDVIAYDDSRFAFAARLWWLMRSIGYRPPRLLQGGYQAYLAAGGRPVTDIPSRATPGSIQSPTFSGCCDIRELVELQDRGAILVDSREERRYCGIEEPIDPVAGHIPGALNRPWQNVTNDAGHLQQLQGLRHHWGDVLDAELLVVYCGSGVTACVNLYSLYVMGRDDAILYAGSWSDWCSYLHSD